MAIPTRMQCNSSIDLEISHVESAPLKTKPFTCKLFLLGFLIPVFPWAIGAFQGVALPHFKKLAGAKSDDGERSRVGDAEEDCNGNLILSAEKEFQYWGWVCLFSLVAMLVLAGVTALMVLLNHGIIGRDSSEFAV